MIFLLSQYFCTLPFPPNEYGKITGSAEADYDYKIVAQYRGGNSGLLEVDITRNELDVQRLREEYAALFEMPEMSEFPYTLDVFEQKTFHIKKKLSELSLFHKPFWPHNIL